MKLYTFVVHYQQMCMKKYGCCGGVLIAISNEYITSQVTELDTNCEIVWATIKSTGNKTLYLGTYYKPIVITHRG
jgi:hypothetical protein